MQQTERWNSITFVRVKPSRRESGKVYGWPWGYVKYWLCSSMQGGVVYLSKQKWSVHITEGSMWMQSWISKKLWIDVGHHDGQLSQYMLSAAEFFTVIAVKKRRYRREFKELRGWVLLGAEVPCPRLQEGSWKSRQCNMQLWEKARITALKLGFV